MKQKALVIGGTGFLGRYLVEELLQEDYDVSVLCRNQPEEWPFEEIKFYLGSIEDAFIVNEAISGKDVVFHLAAKAGVWGTYDSYYGPNVRGTKLIIEACDQHKVPQLIYTSTPSVVLSNKEVINGNENLPIPSHFFNNYQKTKSIAEQLIINANSDRLKTVAIRPQAIWGDGDVHVFPRILQKLKNGSLRIVGSGTNKISVAFVKNVAWAHVLAAKSDGIGGNVYFINDEKPVNPWQWIKDNTSLLKYEMSSRKIPKSIAYGLSGIVEFIYKIFSIESEPPFTRYMVCEVSNNHYFSIEKAKNDFGYYEKYALDTGQKEFQKYLVELNKTL
ncbi:NAD-dependent epimerase/dehydratase family protein [Flavobacteriaceae bacterium M23B6Z8]